MKVKSVTVFSNGGGNYVIKAQIDNGQEVSWSGPVHLFSHKSDLQECVTEVINQALAIGAKP